MRNIILLTCMLSMFLLSCDCRDCYDNWGTYAGEFCRGDYSTQQEFEDAIDMVYDSGGYCD